MHREPSSPWSIEVKHIPEQVVFDRTAPNKERKVSWQAMATREDQPSDPQQVIGLGLSAHEALEDLMANFSVPQTETIKIGGNLAGFVDELQLRKADIDPAATFRVDITTENEQ